MDGKESMRLYMEQCRQTPNWKTEAETNYETKM